GVESRSRPTPFTRSPERGTSCARSACGYKPGDPLHERRLDAREERRVDEREQPTVADRLLAAVEHRSSLCLERALDRDRGDGCALASGQSRSEKLGSALAVLRHGERDEAFGRDRLVPELGEDAQGREE